MACFLTEITIRIIYSGRQLTIVAGTLTGIRPTFVICAEKMISRITGKSGPNRFGQITAVLRSGLAGTLPRHCGIVNLSRIRIGLIVAGIQLCRTTAAAVRCVADTFPTHADTRLT